MSGEGAGPRAALPPAGGSEPPGRVAARFLGGHDRSLLARVEDAGLNASAPPQQRWMDGWLVRCNPGKAQRARCVNAVAAGRRPTAEKLGECAALYRALGLPMLVRITPFTEPASLDAELAARGFVHHDDTRVMVLARLERAAVSGNVELPAGMSWHELAADDYAEVVGAMRGSSAEARRAHAERLRQAPVPYRGFVLGGPAGEPLSCGQFCAEGTLVGLYDVATAASAQRQGWASWLCKRLLTVAANEAGSTSAYLQVGADNDAARRIYARLGFEDAYSYHYRMPPSTAAGAAPG